MTAAIALRPDLDLTLGSLRAQRQEQRSAFTSVDVATERIQLRVDDNDPKIVLGDVEVPVSETGMNALGDHYGVPAPFFKRLGKEVGLDAQAYVLARLMNNDKTSALRAEYSEGGLISVATPGREVLDPNRLLDVATRVLGTEEAPVQRLIDTSGEFAFDVHVPFGYDRGVGGDPEDQVEIPEDLLGYSWATKSGITADSRVGDLTAAGLRFGYDRKRNLTPYVQPWMMRLACTNGMETTNNGLKVDARGMSVDEVLAEIEAAARQAFAQVEGQIEHFYDLRNTPVDNPERALRAIAVERGIPDRSLVRMLDLAPSNLLPERPTQFDIVNLITNLANHSSVRNNGGRLLLEQAGGGAVADHAIRCSHCQHSLA